MCMQSNEHTMKAEFQKSHAIQSSVKRMKQTCSAIKKRIKDTVIAIGLQQRGTYSAYTPKYSTAKIAMTHQAAICCGCHGQSQPFLLGNLFRLAHKTPPLHILPRERGRSTVEVLRGGRAGNKEYESIRPQYASYASRGVSLMPQHEQKESSFEKDSKAFR